MNRKELIDDILSLVDSDPLNDVDIHPLIKKYATASDVIDEIPLRQQIISALIELKQEQEVTYDETKLRQLNTLSGERFNYSNLLIRSTRQRVKELDKKIESRTSISAQTIGTVFSHSSFSDLHSPIAPTTINNNPANPPKRSWLEKTVWIISIAAGLVVVYEFILKRFM